MAGYDFVRERDLNVALFLLVVLAGVVLINNGLKWLVDRERPPVVHLVGTSGLRFRRVFGRGGTATWFAVALVIARDWCADVAGVLRPVSLPSSPWPSLRPELSSACTAHRRGGWRGRGLGLVLLSALAFGGRLQRLGAPAARRRGAGRRGRLDR